MGLQLVEGRNERDTRSLMFLSLAYCLWTSCTQWTSILLPYLQWDTRPSMTFQEITVIHTFGSICNALGAFLIGQFVDTAGGCKTVLLLSAALTGGYYAALSFCTTTEAFLAVQLLRVGYHFDAAAEIYVVGATAQRRRTNAVLSLSLPQAAALLLGPLVGARLAIWFGFRNSQLLCGLVLLFGLFPLIYKRLPDNDKEQTNDVSDGFRPQDYWRMVLTRPALREALILRILIVVPHIAYELICRQFLMRYLYSGTWQTATFMLTNAASIVAVQFLILPALQRRYTPRQILQVALVAQIVSYLSVSFAGGFKWMLVVSALQAAAYALAYAESTTQITSAVDAEQLGKAAGLASATTWLGHTVIPLLAGRAVAVVSYVYVFYGAAVVTTLSVAYVTVICRYVDARLNSILPVFGRLS